MLEAWKNPSAYPRSPVPPHPDRGMSVKLINELPDASCCR